MIEIAPERPSDAAAIETLLDHAFGPGRLAKSSYSYRARISRIWPLCLVARDGHHIVGTIRYWPIAIGADPALLLGPVAVHHDQRSTGVGGLLMRASLARAATAGHRLVVLVGDEPYYGRFGFRPAQQWGITMKRESPTRVLALPLGTVPIPAGVVRRWRSVRRDAVDVLAA